MTNTLSGPMLVPPLPNPRHLMVLLHGYGSDGNDLIAIGRHWSTSLSDTIFVSPNAPEPCEINPSGYQWFPLQTDRVISRVTGAERARDVVVNFLIDVWAQSGIGPENTMLLGFSQGAMMALHAGLSLDVPLAGIVAFSGALVPPAGLVEGYAPKTPVCILHGGMDNVVDPALSEEAVTTLTELGYEVSSFVAPEMGHGISEAMLAHALDFVRDKFA